MLNIRKNIPLASLTTFEIGGVARFFVEVTTEDELTEALAWALEHGLRTVVLAGGSNVLVPDKGLEALVVRIIGKEYFFTGEKLSAHAGCNLLALIRAASAEGLGGWEKLAGIPGTVGGAARGNAGAFGTEIKDVATKVHALNAETGEIRTFKNSECDFSYRHSHFKNYPEWIILDVEVRLERTEPKKSVQLIEETIVEREKRHLQNVRAAGSFFMNPIAPPEVRELFEKEKGVKSREGRVPAGWLIEKAGMKGAKVGGAIASLQHPNYIVNTGSATSEDVRVLAEQIKQAVEQKFGMRLEEEAAIFV